jgi:hypothetical protein
MTTLPHTHEVAEALLWIVRFLLVYGLAMGVWFLARWWPHVDPKDRFSLAALDVGGWVAAFVVVYAAILVNVVFWPTPNHDPDIVKTRVLLILFTVVINVAMTIRCLHWRRIRRSNGVGYPRRRITDVEPLEFK